MMVIHASASRHVAVVTLVLLTAACGSTSQSGSADAMKSAPAGGSSMQMGPPATLADWTKGAKLFNDLGTYHRQITTTSPEAQQYFDQGMRLMWAFNHDEATRSFAKAATIDPACGMCYWGVALSVGPNYNLPVMAPPRAQVAFDAVQSAKKNAAKATPVEQALITALATRYPDAKPLDPTNNNPVFVAYANAMRDVAKQFPSDADVQVMFAEALMDTNAWKLWTNDGKPAIGTPEIEETLERVLAAAPNHPGANHYYIHTMEASPHPEKALASAERLHNMEPGAGHLQHMPAHIYQRVGRYEDAAQANRDGMKADDAYMAATQPLDYYGMYVAHNYQFLGYSASMEGRQAEAREAAHKMREEIPVEMLLQMPGMDWAVSQVYMTMIRFGAWDAIVAEPAPDARLKTLTGGYLFARVLAFCAKDRLDAAKESADRLKKLAADLPPDAAAGFNSAKDILGLAILIADANIAHALGKHDEALAKLREAAAKEDQLSYDEPADWFVPVRHQLGAWLLAAGKAAEAEKVYRADLVQHPKNGWALFGLAQALTAEKKSGEAAKVQKEFAEAWKNADVKLSGSIF